MAVACGVFLAYFSARKINREAPLICNTHSNVGMSYTHFWTRLHSSLAGSRQTGAPDRGWPGRPDSSSLLHSSIDRSSARLTRWLGSWRVARGCWRPGAWTSRDAHSSSKGKWRLSALSMPPCPPIPESMKRASEQATHTEHILTARQRPVQRARAPFPVYPLLLEALSSQPRTSHLLRSDVQGAPHRPPQSCQSVSSTDGPAAFPPRRNRRGPSMGSHGIYGIHGARSRARTPLPLEPKAKATASAGVQRAE